jgi:hypothetical protein
MSWRVHSWDAASATGEVVSSHFGPWPFASTSGVQFETGEEVLVELGGPSSAYRVTDVRPARQRQPDGTIDPVFAQLNARHCWDAYVERQTPDTLAIWVGDCCHQCGPSWLVTFRDIAHVHGLSEHGDIDAPLFRLASADERREHALTPPAGACAYCIVTNHGFGADGPHIYVVARTVDITPYTRPAPGAPAWPT